MRYNLQVSITMAAIDPTAKPQSDGPKRATLKIIRRPISSMYSDMSDSDEDDEDDEDEESEGNTEESEDETPKKGGKSDKKKKGVKEDKMDVDSSGGKEKKGKGDLDDLSDDEMETVEMEDFVLCTLDVEKASLKNLVEKCMGGKC